MNTKGLGVKQQAIIKQLKQGRYILSFEDYSNAGGTIDLRDDDGNIYESISAKMLSSLVHRDLLKEEKVYSTVSPNTETYKYTLITAINN